MGNNKGGNKFASNIVDSLLGKKDQDPKRDDSAENIGGAKLVGARNIFSTPGHLPTTEAALAQSENLRVAQQRILELEEEIDRLRRENEQLIAAGQTLNRRMEELAAKNENVTKHLNEERESYEDEKRLLNETLQAKDRESSRLTGKVEELELRLATDLKKIRVRERELENRLEIMKMEGAAVISNKDEIILELKRRIDQLTLEADQHRHRENSMSGRIDQDQEKTRRAVKAMRLALSMLEEEENSATPLKKVK